MSNPYSNIGLTEDETAYFHRLYELVTREGHFEGLKAVKFLQQSKLSKVSREESVIMIN